MDGFEQLDERGFAVMLRDVALGVAGDDLAEQRDFFHAARDQLATFGNNVGNAAAALFAAGVGHDAKRAILVTALHDADKGGDGCFGVAVQQMLANGRLASRLDRDIDDFVPPAGEEV